MLIYVRLRRGLWWSMLFSAVSTVGLWWVYGGLCCFLTVSTVVYIGLYHLLTGLRHLLTFVFDWFISAARRR